MEFIRDPNIDFMKARKFWVWVSVALVALSIFAIFIHGSLNLGIDFAGGTQLTVKFRQQPETDRIRAVVVAAGIEDALIQSFGEPEDNEIIIKTPTVEGSEEGNRKQVIDALRAGFPPTGTGTLDVNREGRAAIADRLTERDPEGLRAAGDEDVRERYEAVADAILGVRRDLGLVTDWSQLEGLEGVGAASIAELRSDAVLGEFAVLGAENVGPQIGRELRRKGILAIVSSLIGMLAYIWFRFELRFGVGALVAVTHDVMITLGFFALADFEFNLTTIAAFLTLVGYSVNDSVVVFDRVRENLRRKPNQPLIDIMNRSLNQTLSRTILTSGTTLLAVGSLFFLGGDVLRGFGFIISVGVVIGTYSSIYVASPFAILWDRLFGREARLKRAA